MNKRSAILVLAIFLLSNVLAECNETQIDINSASLEELDNLTGVGPVIAQNIINTRPFNSVDDLLNVSRIGNKTLEKIKQQGLACISFSERITSINNSQANQTLLNPEENISLQSNQSNIPVFKVPNTSSSQKKPPVSEVISLAPADSKNIKTNNNLWSPDKIAVYSFIAFSILIVALFILRTKRHRKTEFEA